MPTHARYFPALALPTTTNVAPQHVLVIDSIGKINSLPLLTVAEQTKLIDIGNAAIVSAIALREQEIVGGDEFNGVTLMLTLIKYVSKAIDNKVDVALELYRSWQRVSQLDIADEQAKLAPTDLLLPIASLSQLIDQMICTLLISSCQHYEPLVLDQVLSYLTNNKYGLPFKKTVCEKMALFNIDCHIDAYFAQFKPDEQVQLALFQLDIQKKLMGTSQWLVSLKDYLDYELTAVMDNGIDPALLAAALNELLLANYINFTIDEDLKEQLNDVCKTLQMNKVSASSFVSRDKPGDRPTYSLYKQGAVFAIRKAVNNIKMAKGIHLELSTTAILGIMPSVSRFAVLHEALCQLLEPFAINIHYSDIFELMLLKMAGITEFPSECKFDSYQIPDNLDHFDPIESYFKMLLGLNPAIVNRLIEHLNKTYGEKTAEMCLPLYQQTHKTAILISLPVMLEKILPDWYACLVDTLVADQRLYQAYRVLSGQTTIALDKIIACAKTLGKPYQLTVDSHFFEALLLQAFAIDSYPACAAIIQGKDSTIAVLDMEIILAIPVEQALLLATRINKQFPEACASVKNTITLKEKEQLYSLCPCVTLDKATVMSAAFQQVLADTLAQRPDFVKHYQVKPPVDKLPAITLFTPKQTRSDKSEPPEVAGHRFCTLL